MNQKWRILLISCFVTLLLVSIVPAAQAQLGNPLLKLGSTGPDVVELQTKLNYLGFNSGSADGIFGNKTRQALVSFQASNNLSADGVVGPLTAGTLNNAYATKVRQAKAQAIISTAEQYIGVRYQWGGSSPATGFDCSGFTSYVFAQNGITLPRTSVNQYAIGSAVSYSNLQPGDLVFFSFAKNGIVDHVGIYVGNNQFINASSSKGVTIYTLSSYWQNIFMGGRRVF